MEGMERTAMTNTIAIVGKSRQVSQAELDKFSTVYTVGTNPIEADMYLCLHGEKSKHPDRDVTWDDFEHVLREYQGTPLVNSICILMADIAYMREVLGCFSGCVYILASPLISKREYMYERAGVAYWVGYLSALGVTVFWEGGWQRSITMPYMYTGRLG